MVDIVSVIAELDTYILDEKCKGNKGTVLLMESSMLKKICWHKEYGTICVGDYTIPSYRLMPVVYSDGIKGVHLINIKCSFPINEAVQYLNRNKEVKR